MSDLDRAKQAPAAAEPQTLAGLLAQVIADAAARGISRAEMAEACGQLYSLFMRQTNPDDPVHFPADEIVPLILITGDSRLLEYFVRHTAGTVGLVLVKDRPRWRPTPAGITGHQKLLTDYLVQLLEWKEGKISRETLLGVLDRVRGELMAVRRVVAKSDVVDVRQGKLFGSE